MADRVSKKVRSRIMSAIRGKDTKPERILWDMLRELQEPPERWANLPGKPDFVFERAGVLVFVDGCFWHRCPKHSSSPKTNPRFWRDKFAANVARDRKVDSLLSENGWIVMRFWECALLGDPDDVLYRIESEIEDRVSELRENDKEWRKEIEG